MVDENKEGFVVILMKPSTRLKLRAYKEELGVKSYTLAVEHLLKIAEIKEVDEGMKNGEKKKEGVKDGRG